MEKKDLPILNETLLAFIFGGLVAGIGISLVLQAGLSPQFLTDDTCNDLMNNSFMNGTYYGMEYTVALITQKAIKCEQIPINYSNHSYTLYSLECLQLNSQQEEKKTWQQ